MKRISIIIPAHNEEENISIIYAELQKVLQESKYDFECIFVDDGSTDNTLNELKVLNAINSEVRYIGLSRNFGKDQALQAGIKIASGDAVITMDADLQHPPSMILKMIKHWENGYDVVYAHREISNPNVKIFQKLSSNLFYKIINLVSEINLEDGIADYRLIDKKVVIQLKQINEFELFLRGMIKWVGFKQIGITYIPPARRSGETSYSSYQLLKLALNGVMSFSVRPLYAVTFIGLFFSITSLFYIPYVLISYFFGFTQASGWASLIATVAFFGGIQLFVLGIIGMYLGKLFMQAKQRPNYIISSGSEVNLEDDIIKL